MEVYVSQYRKMTNEIREEILKLWNEGKSGSEIAQILGITRNSVIGVSYRARKNGIISYKKPKEKKAKKVPKKTKVKENIEPIAEEIPEVVVVEDNSCSMEELKYYSCRFIVSGDTYETVRYCGERIHTSSYCLHHYKICYYPAKMSSKELWNDRIK